MTAIFNVTESTTTVTTVDDVTTIEISTAGLQGASYDRGDPIYVTVRNATGATLAKGSIVYTSGGNGTHTQVSKALATSDSTSARVLGWLAESIANNASGLCQVEGYLDGINTQGITEGTQLYLSGTTAGDFQTTKPQAPVHLVYVGVCVKASAGNGRVYVKVQNGYELDELHDTQITSPQNNDVLTYETATGLWKNKTNPADGVTSVVFSSPLTGGTVTSAGTVGLNQSLLSITSSQVSDLSTTLSAYAALGSANTFTLGQTINTGGTANKGLVIQGVASQSANLVEVQTSSSTAVRINQVGNTTFFGNITSNNNIVALPNSTATVPLIVRGAASQSADLLQIQDSSATNLLQVTALGVLRVNNYTDTAASGAYINMAATSPVTVLARTATNKALVVQGAASQSANLQEWQNSAGGILSRVNSSGNFLMPSLVVNYDVQITAGADAVKPLIVKAFSASQSANLQEWQNSGGTAVAYIGSGGASRFQVLQGGLGAETDLRSRNSGGELTMLRQTTAATNPGANYARLYFRAGTNANTLKLVVIAGAAGAETTILDNIPT